MKATEECKFTKNAFKKHMYSVVEQPYYSQLWRILSVYLSVIVFCVIDVSRHIVLVNRCMLHINIHIPINHWYQPSNHWN